MKTKMLAFATPEAKREIVEGMDLAVRRWLDRGMLVEVEIPDDGPSPEYTRVLETVSAIQLAGNRIVSLLVNPDDL